MLYDSIKVDYYCIQGCTRHAAITEFSIIRIVDCCKHATYVQIFFSF